MVSFIEASLLARAPNTPAFIDVQTKHLVIRVRRSAFSVRMPEFDIEVKTTKDEDWHRDNDKHWQKIADAAIHLFSGLRPPLFAVNKKSGCYKWSDDFSDEYRALMAEAAIEAAGVKAAAAAAAAVFAGAGRPPQALAGLDAGLDANGVKAALVKLRRRLQLDVTCDDVMRILSMQRHTTEVAHDIRDSIRTWTMPHWDIPGLDIPVVPDEFMRSIMPVGVAASLND